jgi:hypothetical protein
MFLVEPPTPVGGAAAAHPPWLKMIVPPGGSIVLIRRAHVVWGIGFFLAAVAAIVRLVSHVVVFWTV